MALVDRLTQPGQTGPDPPGGYIMNHFFSAAVYLWGQGVLTRANVVNGLNLSPDDEVQLDQLKATYDGLTNAKKDAFHGRLEALNTLLEGGYITKAFYKNNLGLT